MKSLLKKVLYIGLTITVTAAMSFNFAVAEETVPENDIAIIYTSDINSEVASNLELSGMVAYGNGLKAEVIKKV